MNNFKDIKVVVSDVDGCLTSGEYIVSDTGSISKSFYTRDFYTIERLLNEGIHVIILTQSNDKVINKRIEEIAKNSKYWKNCLKYRSLVLFTNVDNKFEKLKNYLTAETSCSLKDVAYIGDSENDLKCMEKCRVIGCPNDAIKSIKDIDGIYISEYDGGKGAVYDFIMYILEKMEKNNENFRT